MRCLIILFLLTVSFLSLSQYGDDKEEMDTLINQAKYPLFSLGGKFGFGGTLISQKKGAYQNPIGSYGRPQIKHMVGLLGLNADLKFKKWIGMNIGLDFFTLTVKSKSNIGPITYYKKQTLMADIPIRLNFYFGPRDINFVLTGGFSANFLVYNNTSWVFSSSGPPYNMPQGEYIEPQKFHFNIYGQVGMGVDYQISDHFSFRTLALFKSELVSKEEFVVERKYFTLTAEFSFFYNFKTIDLARNYSFLDIL